MEETVILEKVQETKFISNEMAIDEAVGKDEYANQYFLWQ
jgi:hypothetical protein